MFEFSPMGKRRKLFEAEDDDTDDDEDEMLSLTSADSSVTAESREQLVLRLKARLDAANSLIDKLCTTIPTRKRSADVAINGGATTSTSTTTTSSFDELLSSPPNDNNLSCSLESTTLLQSTSSIVDSPATQLNESSSSMLSLDASTSFAIVPSTTYAVTSMPLETKKITGSTLPPEVLLHIFRHLEWIDDLYSAACVCRAWRTVLIPLLEVKCEAEIPIRRRGFRSKQDVLRLAPDAARLERTREWLHQTERLDAKRLQLRRSLGIAGVGAWMALDRSMIRKCRQISILQWANTKTKPMVNPNQYKQPLEPELLHEFERSNSNPNYALSKLKKNALGFETETWKEYFTQIRLNTLPTTVRARRLKTFSGTKYGGLPDFPLRVTDGKPINIDWEWPCTTLPETKTHQAFQLPMTFIAQIDLNDIHDYDTEGYLPSQGYLYFFWAAHMVTDSQTAHLIDSKEEFKVLYYKPPNNKQERKQVFYGPPPAPKSIRQMKRTFDGSLPLPKIPQPATTTSSSSASSTSSTSASTSTTTTTPPFPFMMDLWTEPTNSSHAKTHKNVLFSVLTESRVTRRGAYLPIVAPRKEDHEAFFGKQRRWSWTGAARKSIRRDILKSPDCELLSQEEKNSWFISDDPQQSSGTTMYSIALPSDTASATPKLFHTLCMQDKTQAVLMLAAPLAPPLCATRNARISYYLLDPPYYIDRPASLRWGFSGVGGAVSGVHVEVRYY
eukprot:TRINITY_DN9781_c0_g1_i1.p1 TRINITY_DN9781_c0_g1~~TRINITY_DN9781_c0_g1_i1.p1  ORF type:complete len:728 (+),score=95.07 TRINITY_DN9781_c0_g1_i1:270-2453(+)